jgi:hypothetical protein
MAARSILLQVDDKATQALADAAAAQADATQALSDAAAAQTAAANALNVTTKMFWNNSKGASSVTATDLVTSIEKPLIVTAAGGNIVGPISYSILTSAGYTVNSGAGWSSVIHLINKSGGVLTVKLGDPTLVTQELAVDGAVGGQGEPVAIWYNFNTSVWEMASSAV